MHARLRKLNGVKSGLIPHLVSTLTDHAALARETADARARHAALDHLLQCREELRRLTRLVEKAELADATKACSSLEGMMASAPKPVLESEVLADMKVRGARVRVSVKILIVRSASALLCATVPKSSLWTRTREVLSYPHLSSPSSRRYRPYYRED